MSRLEKRFSELRRDGRTALIPFVTAGDPEPSITVPLMHALVSAGADVLELGVPFSDPMVLMGYLNPVEVMGCEAFASAAADAGVDGVITVDLPPEEAGDYVAAFRKSGLDPIFLLAPTSTEERVRKVADVASGFIYYVSLRGVTGAAHIDTDEVKSRLDVIRKHTALPIGVGFGIKSPDIAARVATVADAVVVGSALVSRIGELADQPDAILKDVPAFLASLREAVDTAEAAA
jgi:tryptophan synthase alpha chain